MGCHYHSIGAKCYKIRNPGSTITIRATDLGLYLLESDDEIFQAAVHIQRIVCIRHSISVR